MARTAPLFSTLAAMILLMACDERIASNIGDVTAESPEETLAHDGGLALDNGRKWPVSPHMMVPIRRMRERLAEVDTASLEVPDAPRVLADSLFIDMDELVRTCDMKGPAHDMLHEWLMPHMTLLQRLERAPSADSARHIVLALDRSNALFDQYFE